MSLLKKPIDNDCSCKSKKPTGTMRVRVIPKKTDLREEAKYDEKLQLLHADRVQNLFFLP